MSKRLDIKKGDVFTRLTVIGEERDSKNRLKYKCSCVCGNVSTTEASHLVSGKSKSCGCLHKEKVRKISTKHGYQNTSTYKSWEMMIQRGNLESNCFINYREKGITVCPEWEDFKKFLEDMGERPEGYSLDRKDNTKGYCKENCRWADNIVQAINKGIGSNNTSGIKGVSWSNSRNMWRACLTLRGKSLLDVYFDNKQEAITARKEAEEKYFKPLLEEVS